LLLPFFSFKILLWRGRDESVLKKKEWTNGGESFGGLSFFIIQNPPHLGN